MSAAPNPSLQWTIALFRDGQPWVPRTLVPFQEDHIQSAYFRPQPNELGHFILTAAFIVPADDYPPPDRLEVRLVGKLVFDHPLAPTAKPLRKAESLVVDYPMQLRSTLGVGRQQENYPEKATGGNDNGVLERFDL